MKIMIIVIFLCLRIYGQTSPDSFCTAEYSGITIKNGFFFVFSDKEKSKLNNIVLYSKHHRTINNFKDSLTLNPEEILLFELFLSDCFFFCSDFQIKTGYSFLSFSNENRVFDFYDKMIENNKEGSFILKKILVSDVPILLFQINKSVLLNYFKKIMKYDKLKIESEWVTIGIILDRKSIIAKELLKNKL